MDNLSIEEVTELEKQKEAFTTLLSEIFIDLYKIEKILDTEKFEKVMTTFFRYQECYLNVYNMHGKQFVIERLIDNYTSQTRLSLEEEKRKVAEELNTELITVLGKSYDLL